ncbi:MAG: hypothetical protein NTU41_01895 [Chloroflexi bacterium]|nr:hypothetical protein [Chloroflexota bacterium]
MANMVFTDEELAEMGARTVDLLSKAIEAGDKGQAERLAQRMYSEAAVIHDLYVDWTAGLMDYIYKNCGEDALYQALREIIVTPPASNTGDPKADFRRRVRRLASALRGHLQPMKVTEDHDKVCIKMEPCGSGQRLLQRLDCDPERRLSRIQKPHRITWGLEDFPVYCAHSPVMEILSIEAQGYPDPVAVPAPRVARESCTYCVYKDPATIPEEMYTRVGKRKPARE